MNSWQRVLSLSSGRISQITEMYQAVDIPIEIRHHLASWVEVKIGELDSRSFIKELQLQMETLPFFVRERCTRFWHMLNDYYTHNPDLLLEKFRQCRLKEMELIQVEDSQVAIDSSPTQTLMEISENLQQSSNVGIDYVKYLTVLKLRSKEVDEILKQLYNDHDKFISILQTVRGRNSPGHQIEGLSELMISENLTQNHMWQSTEELTDALKSLVHTMRKTFEFLTNTFSSILKELLYLHENYIVKNLSQWKLEQKRSIIGFIMSFNISNIQHSCEDIAEIIYALREQLKRAIEFKLEILNDSYDPQKLAIMLSEATQLLKDLAQVTFFIENHPLPIIQKDAKFLHDKRPLTVGSLIAEKLNPRMSPPDVKVTLITSKVKEEIIKECGGQNLISATFPENPIGTFKNNVSKMQNHHPDRPHFSAEFQYISLTSLTNSRRRGHTSSELVTDEKYFLLCTSTFAVSDLNIHVWTISDPILIITHVSQLPKAWGTILWEYGPSQSEEISAEMPRSWSSILECLNAFFGYLVGVDLTEDHKCYLTKKATNTKTGKQIGTLKELCKDDLDGRNFSFWEWFYHSTKLVEVFFKNEWRSCEVIGFIGREDAEILLKSCQPWTFLLRFSDSTPGAISIVCRIDEENDVCSLEPFTKDALRQRSLAGKISDLVELKFVYPNIPKQDIFKTSENNGKSERDRYLAMELRISRPWSLKMQTPANPDFDLDIDEILNCLESMEKENESADFTEL